VGYYIKIIIEDKEDPSKDFIEKAIDLYAWNKKVALGLNLRFKK
jgi:hypothetical protein